MAFVCASGSTLDHTEPKNTYLFSAIRRQLKSNGVNSSTMLMGRWAVRQRYRMELRLRGYASAERRGEKLRLVSQGKCQQEG